MVNKWIGIGNLGADPEVRYTQSGSPVCSFKIACSEKYKDASGNMQESTEWVPVVAWKRLAEICGEYLRKGSKVYIEGKLQTRKWQDQDGKDRYTTEIVAREMKMLSARSDVGGGHGGGQGQGGSGQEPPPMGDDSVPF